LRSCAPQASSDRERPAEQDEANEQDEQRRANEHRERAKVAPLLGRAERAKRDVQRDRADAHRRETDRHDARGDADELRIHGSDVTTMIAALFDFDETMIDLEHEHDAAHRALCREMGSDYDAMPQSFRFGSGRRIVDDITEMQSFFGWTTPHEQLQRIRHRHFLDALAKADLVLMRGVERVVRELHAGGVTLAITTSAVSDAVDLILRRAGIRELFTLIVDGSEVASGKPDPEAYLLTARKLGAEPRDCVVFEDSRVGVLAAKAARMFCVAVRNPAARTFQDLSAADVVLDSFDELNVAGLMSR
jgi:HAD superfamily hydrolase (TIGR01509 family)